VTECRKLPQNADVYPASKIAVFVSDGVRHGPRGRYLLPVNHVTRIAMTSASSHHHQHHYHHLCSGVAHASQQQQQVGDLGARATSLSGRRSDVPPSRSQT